MNHLITCDRFMPACTVYSDTQCPDIALKWLEDETFFSICSRQHAAWGNLHLKTTFGMLFDSTSHATKHDFPHSLDTLQANIRSVLCIPVMLPTGSSDCDPPVLEVLPSHSSGCDPLRRRSCPIPKACRCVIART